MEAQKVTLHRHVDGVMLNVSGVEVYCTDAEDLEEACENEADTLYSEYSARGFRVSGELTLPSRGGIEYGKVRINILVTRKGNM